MKKINYIIGDATEPVGAGNKIIAHVCNNKGGWGKGFVLAISKKWGYPEEHYRSLNKYYSVLGTIGVVRVDEGIYVANMVCQDGYKSSNNPIPLRYNYLNACLNSLRETAEEVNASVHMPRIGCGLAGGNWTLIEPIIQKTLVEKGIEVFVYDLTEEDTSKYE